MKKISKTGVCAIARRDDTKIHRILLMVSALLCGIMLLLGAANANTPVDLNDSQIKQLITNKRIYLAVPLGGEFPLQYLANGEVNGSGEAVGLGRFLKPNDKGKWWVKNNQMCQQWQEWYDKKVFCFRLQKLEGNKLKWYKSDGEIGLARVAD